MMQQLGGYKAEIARTKNMGLILRAQYKEKMASVRHDLKLSGRFTGILAWAESRVIDAYTNVKMNLDSIHDSE